MYVVLDKELKFNVEWKNKTDAKQRFIEMEKNQDQTCQEK